ncbi:MAG TPA: hypothetical protein VF659_10650, partial [Pyrinomonadaceae bacterium]
RGQTRGRGSKSHRFRPRPRVCVVNFPCYTFGVAETEHFVNDGTGWECKRCRARDGGAASGGGPGRFFREGEAEGGGPRLSTPARARWADGSRARLCCPACGAEEELKG